VNQGRLVSGGLLVNRNIKFRGKLVRIEGAACKIPIADLNGWYYPSPLVHLQDEFFGIRFFVDIYFREVHAAILEELLGAAAVHAPTGAVDYDFFHIRLDFTLS